MLLIGYSLRPGPALGLVCLLGRRVVSLLHGEVNEFLELAAIGGGEERAADACWHLG